MDYIIKDHAKLFDDLIQVLDEDKSEPHALEYLKAAKFNYDQRSMDHMLMNVVLTIYDLLGHSATNDKLRTKLREVIVAHVNQKFDAAKQLSTLSDQYRASGGKLLTHEEILQEVNERRGTSR
ncbi:MAG TPA: hypothetical protein VK776_12170 [Bryobacteraceae bacterium]|jgi:hypothetical protein|nr:hypothetical protein [Bryobacteraceae bacterium]